MSMLARFRALAATVRPQRVWCSKQTHDAVVAEWGDGERAELPMFGTAVTWCGVPLLIDDEAGNAELIAEWDTSEPKPRNNAPPLSEVWLRNIERYGATEEETRMLAMVVRVMTRMLKVAE